MKKLSPLAFFLAVMFVGMGITPEAKAQSGSNSQKAAITIIEYSDYQCPACAYYHPIIKRVKEKYGDQIKLEYKFYPLNSHQFSALAARAAEAAKNQGKFLEMHNLLFENQNQWTRTGNPTPAFVNYAREIGLNVNQFKDDLNAAETQRAVMEEKQSGRQQGVRATPTFIIEGDIINPLPRTYDQFETIVEQYLNQKKE